MPPASLTRLNRASMPALMFTPQFATAPVRSSPAPTTTSLSVTPSSARTGPLAKRTRRPTSTLMSTAPPRSPFMAPLLSYRSSMPEIRPAHAVVAQELLTVPGEGDRARLEDVAVVRDGQGLVGVLLDEHGGEAQRRLVEQHQDRLGHERAVDRQHLLLAAAERPRQLRSPLGQDGEARVHALERPLDRALVGPRVRPHLEVLEDGQLREELAALGNVRDPEAHDFLGGQALDPAPPEADRSARGSGEPGDALEGRGLARSVGAEQGDDGAFEHLERDALERLDTAVERLDSVEGQERLNRRRH